LYLLRFHDWGIIGISILPSTEWGYSLLTSSVSCRECITWCRFGVDLMIWRWYIVGCDLCHLSSLSLMTLFKDVVGPWSLVRFLVDQVCIILIISSVDVNFIKYNEINFLCLSVCVLKYSCIVLKLNIFEEGNIGIARVCPMLILL